MGEVLRITVGLAMVLGTLVFIGWVMARMLKRAEDPGKLLFKWILSAVLTLGMGSLLVCAPALVPVAAVVYAIPMAIMWAPHVGAALASPITAAFDGGTAPPDPAPLYSPAHAKRKRGQVHEALYHIQEQLEKFPNDYMGQMLIAEIQATDLKDVDAAAMTIQRLSLQPDHAPAEIAAALTQLADWQLKLAADVDGARQSFEKIIELYPDTSQAYAVQQRLAHLPTPGQAIERAAPRTIALPKGEDRLGLRPDASGHLVKIEDPAAEAEALTRQLEAHPLDFEARERLAQLYASHYRRMDLAADQIEQLLSLPHLSAAQVGRWLHLLADLHIQHANDSAGAERALVRLIELYPDHAVAEQARRRLDHLTLELKRNEESRVFRLGSYDRNLGLKRPWDSSLTKPDQPGSPPPDSPAP